MRCDCYRFLSACFCRPQKEVFQEENLLENLTLYLQKICPDAEVFSAAMEKNILQYSNEELLVEYARLFVGPFELKAPPYGSIYLDDERQVMGDSTIEVVKMYEAEGLSRDNEFSDLPDHIAVELEFMSFLIYKEIKAFEQSDFNSAIESTVKQDKFMDLFLGRWVEPFCEKIRTTSDNLFYMSLADCLLTFVRKSRAEHIREAIKEEVVSLK